MSKNKRWKRKAKRMKGYCINNYLCNNCKFILNGYCEGVISNTGSTPKYSQIRTIERICKYGK